MSYLNNRALALYPSGKREHLPYQISSSLGACFQCGEYLLAALIGVESVAVVRTLFSPMPVSGVSVDPFHIVSAYGDAWRMRRSRLCQAPPG